ncbi:MAG TPA: DUF5615 family PIN-like protein [Ignavibacteria bacterium]|nr:DUF5615 family PIN-like protein [Ignavibacteria bacterium]
MQKPKLFIDEDVHSELSTALVKRGFDAIHAQEQKRKGLTDLEQIQYAINQNRCFFTFNVKDFVLLHNDLIKQNIDHYGIIVSKQLTFSATLNKMLNLLQNNSRDSLKNKLLFL